MARERHLPNAPIREAVLDLRFPTAEATDLEELRSALTSLDEFDLISELREASAIFRFSLEEGPEGHVEQGNVTGLRGTTVDGLWVAQFRRDGLTLSRLQPYQDWDELSGQGRRYAERLLEVTQPPRVDRLALRYVNHFRLPHPAQTEEYFVGLLQIPEALPQFISNMLTRVTLHDPLRDFSAHVTHTLLDDLDAERIGFILDIDAFRTAEFPAAVDTLWETFEDLRVFKNQIFFELITELNAEMHE